MNSNNTNKTAWLAALATALLLASGCATTTAPVDEEKPGIEARSMARWDALLGDDLASAYQFLSPGYRSSVTSLQYQRSVLLQRVQWTSAEYYKSECTETTCNVWISLGYKIVGGLPGIKVYEGTQTVEESWVKVDGSWYFVPES